MTWLRWRAQRPSYTPGEQWRRSYSLWLSRRPPRRLDPVGALLGVALLYLAAHVVAWL